MQTDLGLPEDDRRIVSFLAYGHTVDEAARRLRLSRRTAQRRLRRARQELGVATNAEAAVLVASAGSTGAARPPPRSLLTPREHEALDLVAAGLTSAEIAARLGIASSTVDSLIKAAMVKLGARTRIQTAVLARLARQQPPSQA